MNAHTFKKGVLAGILFGLTATTVSAEEYRVIPVAAIHVAHGSGYTMNQLFLDTVADRTNTQYEGKLYSKGYNSFKADFMSMARFTTDSDLSHDGRETWFIPAVGKYATHEAGQANLHWITPIAQAVPETVTIQGTTYKKGPKTGMYMVDRSTHVPAPTIVEIPIPETTISASAEVPVTLTNDGQSGNTTFQDSDGANGANIQYVFEDTGMVLVALLLLVFLLGGWHFLKGLRIKFWNIHDAPEALEGLQEKITTLEIALAKQREIYGNHTRRIESLSQARKALEAEKKVLEETNRAMSKKLFHFKAETEEACEALGFSSQYFPLNEQGDKVWIEGRNSWISLKNVYNSLVRLNKEKSNQLVDVTKFITA